MAWYYSPNQTGPVWINEAYWTNTTTATSTVGTVYYDTGWELGTGWITSATTVSSPTFWIRRGLASDATRLSPQQPPIRPPASPAIIREREAIAQHRVEQMAAADRECAARRQRLDEAQHRARELLLEHLTPEQRQTVKDHGWFVVEGKRQRYRIETHRGYAGNVVALGRRDLFGRDSAIQRYCAHCDPGVAPGHDQFLAQKFMLEHAEDDFLRIANRH